MDETKKKTFKHIVKGCALALCVLFFTVPLVECSKDSSINASGWEITSGSGELMKKAEESYPIAFLLVIIPVALLALAFTDKSFSILRNISIAGAAVEIIFIIVARSKLNSGDLAGAFVLTGFNWLILLIYVGLIGFMQYCIIQDKPVESGKQYAE